MTFLKIPLPLFVLTLLPSTVHAIGIPFAPLCKCYLLIWWEIQHPNIQYMFVLLLSMHVYGLLYQAEFSIVIKLSALRVYSEGIFVVARYRIDRLYFIIILFFLGVYFFIVGWKGSDFCVARYIIHRLSFILISYKAVCIAEKSVIQESLITHEYSRSRLRSSTKRANLNLGQVKLFLNEFDSWSTRV